MPSWPKNARIVYDGCGNLKFRTSVHIRDVLEAGKSPPGPEYLFNYDSYPNITEIQMGYYQNDLYFGNNSVYEYLWLTEIFFNVEFEDTAYEFWIPNAKWKGIKNLCAPTDKTADYRLWSNPNIDKVHDELGGEFGVSYEQCPFGPPAHRTIDSGKVHLGGPVESLLDNNNTLTLQCRKKPCEVNMCKNGGKCKTDFYAEYKATCECVEPYYGLDCSLTTGLPVTARETFYYSQRDCKKYIFSGSLHITGPNQFMPMLDNGTTFNQFKTYSYTTGLFTNNFGYGDGGRTDFFYPGEELYLRVTSDEQVGFRFLSAGDTTKIRNITTCTDTQHPSFVLWHSGTSSQLLQTRTTGMGNTVHEDCLGTYLTKTQFIGGLMRDLTDDQGELIIQCFNTTNEVAYGVSSPSQGGTASKSDVANAGLIASVVLGVVFIIALVTAVLYYLHRWRKKRSEASRRRSDDPARASREHPLCGLPNNFLAKINHPDSIRVRQQMRCKVIPADRVTKMHELGRGNFGTVYCGLLLGDKSGEESPVAIKELNNSSTGENSEDACQFLVEAQIMRDMNHVNVMCCIGLIEGPPLGIVLDIMTMGDLNTYLGSQDERETSVTVAEKYFFCYQIARGMNYLGRMGIVHRDLATRNCMLGLPSKTTFGFPELKVADFGLSRVVSDQGYYRMENRTKLPFAWMSPEALTERTFNGKSDVWSFGITVWEIFNNCNGTPYGRDKNVFAILTFLNSGLRLEKPECCTKEAYEMMLQCWARNPEDRPDFAQLNLETAELFRPHCPKPIMVMRVHDETKLEKREMKSPVTHKRISEHVYEEVDDVLGHMCSDTPLGSSEWDQSASGTTLKREGSNLQPIGSIRRKLSFKEFEDSCPDIV